MDGRDIVLFDGICNLCNSSVRFLFRIDKHNILHFVHLQSDFSKSLLKKMESVESIDSVAFVTNGSIYYKSEAVFKIFYLLGYPWRAISIFRNLPKWFSDFIYDFIAQYRYKWFGRKQKCVIPNDELIRRFLN